jgi:hypothetical protein
MKEIGEEESNKLEGDRDKEIPAEREQGTRREVVNDHFPNRIGSEWCMNRGFPIGWYSIGLSRCI